MLVVQIKQCMAEASACLQYFFTWESVFKETAATVYSLHKRLEAVKLIRAQAVPKWQL